MSSVAVGTTDDWRVVVVIDEGKAVITLGPIAARTLAQDLIMKAHVAEEEMARMRGTAK